MTKDVFGKYSVVGDDDDDGARYLVLRLDTDINARRAATVYQRLIESAEPERARSLMSIVTEISMGNIQKNMRELGF